MKVTPCECTEPGWCERHQCEKSRHFYELCRRRQDYFEMFENGQSILQRPKINNSPQVACQHRKEVVGEMECPTCRGSVQIKLFSCSIHQQCTVAKPMKELACCLTCEDYSTA